jgi:hypothetical protein
MPSKGKDPVKHKQQVAYLNKRIKFLQGKLDNGGLNIMLRFRVKLRIIDLKHELKQLT